MSQISAAANSATPTNSLARRDTLETDTGKIDLRFQIADCRLIRTVDLSIGSDSRFTGASLTNASSHTLQDQSAIAHLTSPQKLHSPNDAAIYKRPLEHVAKLKDGFQKVPTYQRTADGKERFVDTGSTFVAHAQPSETVQPGEGALDDPARLAESAAMRCTAFGQLRADAAATQSVPMRLRVVGPIALNQLRLSHRGAGFAAHGRHRVHERQQLGNVVAVGARQRRDERNPARVGENMMLRPGFAAIGRVRSSFFPPRRARTDELSTTARARSSWPRRRNSARSTAWSRFHTPARCQRTRRRQHVLPDPQPSSRGNMFHGSPLRSTKRMPVSTARSGIGVRPAYRRLRGRRFGSSGSIKLHSSSSTKGLGIRDRLRVGHATVPSSGSKYKRVVS